MAGLHSSPSNEGGGSAPDYGYKQQSDDDRLADCDRKGGYHMTSRVRRMGLCKTCPARDLKGGDHQHTSLRFGDTLAIHPANPQEPYAFVRLRT